VARVLGFGLADLKACSMEELQMWVEWAEACVAREAPPAPEDA
jgi:hypothetical protein